MSTVVELSQGAYLLNGEIGGRALTLTLLKGDIGSILLDTGCNTDAEGLILPAMAQIGLAPQELSFIVTSHCDLDHVGGNHRMKQAAPAAVLCCGDADRDQVEEPEALWTQRYDAYRADHGIGYDDDVKGWIMSELGKSQPVDLTLRGGERLRLCPDWEVEVVHLPGHSWGHLGLLDRTSRILYGVDAIHGGVIPTLEGTPAMPPTYMYVDAYLDTIRLIEHLSIDTLVTCHWGVKRGDDIRAFCEESRRFVERAEALIREALPGEGGGKSLLELCTELGPKLGGWGQESHRELCYVFKGHLTRLLTLGWAQVVDGSAPLRYRANKA